MKESQPVTLLRKDAELLLRSEVIHDYPWLESYLQQHRKITRELFGSLPIKRQKFLREMSEPILTQAGREWVVVEELYNDLGDDWMSKPPSRCVLCDERLRHEYYIRNLRNGDQIKVGSTCVDRFGIESDTGKTVGQIQIEQARLARRERLSRRYEGIHGKLEDLHLYLKSHPLMIPDRLRRPYLQVGYELVERYDRFLNGKVAKKQYGGFLAEMDSLWERFGDCQEAIERYVVAHRGDRFRPTREIELFLEHHGLEHVIEMLRNKERIDAGTLYRIEERNLLSGLVPEWNRVLSDLGVAVIGLHETSPAYRYRVAQVRHLTLWVTHRQLAFDYGLLIFGEEPIVPVTLEHLVRRSHLHSSEESVQTVLHFMLRNMVGTGYSLYRHYDDTQTLVLRDRYDTYLTLDGVRFAEAVFPVVLGIGRPQDELLNYIRVHRPRQFTAEQIRAFEEARKAYSESLHSPTRRSAR